MASLLIIEANYALIFWNQPQGTPLDGLITDIVITAGVAYARLIGATQLRIMKPINEQVKSYYLSKPGFSYDTRGNFCYRDL
ncbi:hypothetical protein MNBD_GAMMA18-2343 [hydrothermal vent metagenome]|uniref:Uncharacterized protein n=1 Tax=hydrothermal vent metagenome TaxID=652676 RepID=A0A3B1A7V7_9ZZZZ